MDGTYVWSDANIITNTNYIQLQPGKSKELPKVTVVWLLVLLCSSGSIKQEKHLQYNDLIR